MNYQERDHEIIDYKTFRLPETGQLEGPCTTDARARRCLHLRRGGSDVRRLLREAVSHPARGPLGLARAELRHRRSRAASLSDVPGDAPPRQRRKVRDRAGHVREKRGQLVLRFRRAFVPHAALRWTRDGSRGGIQGAARERERGACPGGRRRNPPELDRELREPARGDRGADDPVLVLRALTGLRGELLRTSPASPVRQIPAPREPRLWSNSSGPAATNTSSASRHGACRSACSTDSRTSRRRFRTRPIQLEDGSGTTATTRRRRCTPTRPMCWKKRAGSTLLGPKSVRCQLTAANRIRGGDAGTKLGHNPCGVV